MNKSILRNNKIRFFSLILALAGIISIGIFTQSCNKNEEPLDEAILNSPELEEYIVAGADFEQSLAIYSDGLNKIDFSTLEVTYDAEGRKVVHLPVTLVGSGKIEEKVQLFNEKKEALQKRFPQITSFRADIGEKYFEHSIKNSVNVKGKLLELGINFSRPLLKSGIYEDYGFGECELYNFLHCWAMNANYVEVIILRYTDGTWATYIDNANDAYNSYISMTKLTNTTTGEVVGWKYNGKDVAEFGHTHGAGNSGSNPTPSGAYGEGDPRLEGIYNFIYYNMVFHYY